MCLQKEEEGPIERPRGLDGEPFMCKFRKKGSSLNL